MSDRHPAWLARVLSDLRDFSASLIEPGLAGPGAPLAFADLGPTSLTTLLARVEAFARQTALAIPDAQRKPREFDDLVASPVARGARPSRSPSDYVVHDGRALPAVWLRPDTREQLPMDAARWLVWIATRLQTSVDIEAARLSKQIDEAKFARDGTSTYAVADAAMLDKMRAPLARATRQLRQSISLVCAQAGTKVSPLARRPTPFPSDPPWQRLRRIADALDRPSAAFAGWLTPDEREPSLADVPFLYQRWCGVQILRAANRLGWEWRSDPVGPLFLGGMIELCHEADRVEFWVEPRLAEGQSSRIGWRSPGKSELTPDFLFVTGEAGNRDAFVLDATTSTSKLFLAKKSRYRSQLEGRDPRRIAGVWSTRRPLRAWAAAPIKGSECEVSDPDGFVGVIPIHGSAKNFPALDAWLEDVFRHARAGRLNA